MDKIKKPYFLNQNFVDNMFSCIDGYGLLSYALDDCTFIQKTLKEEFDVFLSINECQKFWKWRSEQWDSSFLSVTDNKEVIEFFLEYVKFIDLDPEQIKEVNDHI